MALITSTLDEFSSGTAYRQRACFVFDHGMEFNASARAVILLARRLEITNASMRHVTDHPISLLLWGCQVKARWRWRSGREEVTPPWNTRTPVREELFGPERLEQHAQSLALAQPITLHPPRVQPLNQRLQENTVALRIAYRSIVDEVANRHSIVPAAEWLLDHYHHVEKHVSDIVEDLPPGYYRQLPKLADGPFAGYPRVFGLTWAYVAHTDSHFDPITLTRFITAYQRVEPLTIGELWAIAISLRLVLVENLRRLSDQIMHARDARAEADALCERLLLPGAGSEPLRAYADLDIDDPFAAHCYAQMAKRLRDQDPGKTPALAWLEQQFSRQEISIAAVVQNAHQRQGASNVSVRNVITSLRHIADFDWATQVEQVSLVDQQLRANSRFAEMDFATRDRYRNAIEQLARGSHREELYVTEQALSAARAAPPADCQPAEAERLADPGYYLIADGRRELERSLGFRPPLALQVRRGVLKLGLAGYACATGLITVLLMGLAVWTLNVVDLPFVWQLPWLLLIFLPAYEVATALANRALGEGVGGEALPGLALEEGVPPTLRTLVAIPAMLTEAVALRELIERLEVHYLCGNGGDLTFALLLDGRDADTAELPGDDTLLSIAVEAMAQLNQRHGPAPTGPRFLLLYRRRLYNASEGCWMGWERKRGKLTELNRLLRGADDTSYVSVDGYAPWVPSEVRYVVTLDSDTQLPRDTIARLVGKMAHPLNQPVFGDSDRVVRGHAILQPRVTPSLPIGRQGSRYQRLFSAPGGMDVYTAAVSDLYQDLFGEGSFAGKGIYAVDAYERALCGRIPENSLLSHDLLEGIFARAGLASDVEVVEAYPERYDVAARRQHRWTRGDWQLLPWFWGRRADRQALTAVGCWKIADNLRRSLLAPSLFGALMICAWLPLTAALAAMGLTLACLIIPALIPIVFALKPHRRDGNWRHHWRTLGRDLRTETGRCLLSLTLLADQAWQMSDAIVRTLYRVYVSHRHLLEWTTASQLAGGERLGVAGFGREMAGGTLLSLALALILAVIEPPAWALVLPLLVLWLVAPLIALWTSRAPTDTTDNLSLAPPQAQALRRIARRTWQFFDTFVTPASHALPPDNFQLDPKPVIAERTSPTNIGLYLLACIAARDFAWIGTHRAVERLEETLATLHAMERCKGHFYNWYDTRSLEPLEPLYVSTVDSGNLAGHLITLACACEAWIAHPHVVDPREGLSDTLLLCREDIAATQRLDEETRTALLNELETLAPHLEATAYGIEYCDLLRQSIDTCQGLLATQTLATSGVVDAATGEVSPQRWLLILQQCLDEHRRDAEDTEPVSRTAPFEAALSRAPLEAGDPTSDGSAPPMSLRQRLRALADQSRQLALAMDFRFLLVTERKLMSIGYAPREDRLDDGCYDLLASEARLASLVAIAKGDLPTRHWFRLGRAVTPLKEGVALISWSGSMFEYLMPSLVMRAPLGSLLEQTNRLVVASQRQYAKPHDIPWGVSESAYNARDIDFTYQYSNFGVPELGLKRGLGDNLVIAPYATALATMVAPQAALENFARLRAMEAESHFGFFEAIDFTLTRLPVDKSFVIVRNVMAHHQGMTIAAIANALLEGRLRSHFHSEPMIQASELLLQERLPREVATLPSPNDADHAAPSSTVAPAAAVRRLEGEPTSQPVTHLLSNGRYSVMLTAAGAGYSRWQQQAITRWREDATCDEWGSFILLREHDSDACWSAGAHPIKGPADYREVVFAEDHARFTRRDGDLTTVLEVLVSGEDDGEVRRVSVTNGGRHAITIDVMSYAELVLTQPPTDDAHPAFAKLFVETDFVPEYTALTATRRRRAAQEAPIWAAHFAVVKGECVGEPQYETDRARFLGRGRQLGNASALGHQPLSNTTGVVLDPVFSLRYTLKIAPGHAGHIDFWTVVAESRDTLLALIDKHHDISAFERARTLAWTQAQVQLRHLDIDLEEAADFQRLAAPILYSDARFRPPSQTLKRGLSIQSNLWPMGISGDLPIVLLRLGDLEDIAWLKRLLRAHEYWRAKGLGVDLVIINDRAHSYLQELQDAIETAVRSNRPPTHIEGNLALGSVYTLRANQLSLASHELLLAVARVVLTARKGALPAQLDALLDALLAAPTIRHDASVGPRARSGITEQDLASQQGKSEAQAPYRRPAVAPSSRPPLGDLTFFNGSGGFDHDGREYVCVLDDGATTPQPWINVIANAGFGFQVSAEGGGYTWADNSRENQLTPWSNDPVSDLPGEVIYVQDADSGELTTVTANPGSGSGSGSGSDFDSNGSHRREAGHPVRHVARHGFGYTRFEHDTAELSMALLQYVPLNDSIKISRLTLENRTARPRRLIVTAYTAWVMGTSRARTAPFLVSEHDTATGALLMRNPWNQAFPGRVGFVDLDGHQSGWTADRREFLGEGSLADPEALTEQRPLAASVGAGYDPCTVQQCTLTLARGESVEVVAFMGQADSDEAARELIERYRHSDLDAKLDEVEAYWQALHGTLQVSTPDPAMDLMLNGWLMYQTLACRVVARSAFYQASGAYGFRDQLQDGMALTFAMPALARHHLLRAAGRQFVEGDVQHWWLPHSGQGVRTRISDDRVWLAFAAATYIRATDDTAVLDERVGFLEGAPLAPEAHDDFAQPLVADEAASLFEHCARALDQALEQFGEHGLPLIGTGDWNDGFNRVGEAGRGESVWLGWLLLRTLALFAPLAEARVAPEDRALAARWRERAETLRLALENEAWDGEWYRRATFDDGQWLGTHDNDACRIDAIAQSWAVLSEGADPDRAAQAMASVERHLILPEKRLALLFTPAFDKTALEPGYIKGYPPGLRENGGQYTHAAMWSILAFAKLGQADKAYALFSLLNPINHALTPEAVQRYRVEPYVIAADVYSEAPHVGRGGWTWYTGSAGWMYQAGVGGILGIRREGLQLIVAPCIPDSWPGFSATVNLEGSACLIRVERASEGQPAGATLDDEPLEDSATEARLTLDGQPHVLVIHLAQREST
ncbi:glucoamylase family protein [Salinicola sp. MH3R3-1]|uniref:GH36-type glycosyl hydrolase domain-containing protein n=1 Tax=Salinicola sp. MH3R3-1 TaxID=1928762 RepID=UPI000B2D3BFB|nr:glucoamylase family protein [Salinicola sp. MH3R3-1]